MNAKIKANKSRIARKSIAKNRPKAKTTVLSEAKTSFEISRPRKMSKQSSSGRIAFTSIPGLQGEGLLQVEGKMKLELREKLSMTRPVFGRIVNVSERTIAEAEAGEPTPQKLIRTYNEVYRLWDALSDVVDSNSLGTWFQSPNDAFEGLKPLEVIERGEIDRLWNMVFQLRSGMPN